MGIFPTVVCRLTYQARAEAKGFQEWQLQHVRELMPPDDFPFFHKDLLKGWGPANVCIPASEAPGNGHGQRQDSKTLSQLVWS